MNTIRTTVGESSGRGSQGLGHRMKLGVQVLVAFFCALAFSPAIQATDFDCPSPGNAGVTCVTRAIIAANMLGGVNRIILGEGSYVLFEAEDHDPMDGVTGLPSITSTLTIMGKGSGINRPDSTTISRAPTAIELFRIFRVAVTGELTLNGLNIVDGRADRGGGILNNGGTVTLTNVEMFRNDAFFGGGIFNNGGGTVTITNSTLSENRGQGGGIRNDGEVTITNSRLVDNNLVQPRECGGIDNKGIVTYRKQRFVGE
jgi:hypothetical protein